MLVVFSPIFVAGTKITFVYNFVAPLRFGHAEHFIIINGWKLLKISEPVLMFKSNEPIKVAHLKK